VAKVANYTRSEIPSAEPLPFDLKLVIQESLEESLGSKLSDVSLDTWIKVFTSSSSRPEIYAALVYKTIIKHLVRSSLEISLSWDDKLLEAATREFTSWITQATDNLAANNNLDLAEMLSAPDWANELEKQRRAFRTQPLPPNPTPRRGFHFPTFKRRPR